ncbi:hypothetical protein B5X24_HaOG216860 [Helicoverpa armigera]|uniref:ZAD domain-containing protein n=1 Tax=Helicoverpa armigera TaxID=29058 RepID=A0A2W1B689_HELAM|nr:hypothetical protein B5X24_HaOG216860 [Helicoverpa armigera]
MYNLTACVVCFNTDTKLISINSGQLRREFHLISGIQIRQGDGMPDYLCFQCTAMVRNFKRFRDRCHRSHYALKEILSRNNEITVRNLKDLNRNLLGIMPQLSYMSLDKTHYEQVKFQWKKHNRIDWCNSSKHNIPVLHCSTLTPDNTFNETTNTVELEFNPQNIKMDIDAIDNYEIPIEKDSTKDEPAYGDTTKDTEIPESFMDNDMYDSGNDQDHYADAGTFPNLALKVENTEGDVDGAEMDEEYASLVPISVKEAKAAVEVYKMFTQALVPLITNTAVQRGWFSSTSLAVLPFQMLLVCLTITFATPMCCAFFNQKASININKIENDIRIRQGDGMPDYLCFQCTAMVRNFKRFRDRCHRSHYALKEILSRNNEITVRNLKDLNRNLLGIMPQLSYMSLDKTHYEQVKFQWKKHNRIDWCNSSKHNIPVLHCSTLTPDNTFNETTNTVELEFNPQNIKMDIDAIDNYEIPIEKDSTKDEPAYGDTTKDTEIPESFMDNDMYDSGNDQDHYADAGTFPNLALKVENTEGDVDGAEMDEEYASLVPISVKEAKAAVEVYKMFTQGKYHCEICNKAYNNEERMKVHLRMHDKHISGKFHCKLCQYYYKTDFLLKTHMTEKHMFKYLCRKCPEVSFDRISAKQHYIWVHLQKGNKKNSNWYESRPKWLNPRGGKRVKGVVTLKPIKKNTKLPEDFLVYSPIGHEEQYKLIQDRQNSRNYQEANYQCHLCYRGFRVLLTYEKHMKKHDPEYSGPLQCDICKIFFKDQRKLYKHMNITHLYKYSCQLCSFVCCNRGQAHMHYRWHKNVTYECPHCKREFLKASTRLTHIRIKHPSMCLCIICGHSFVSDSGLYCHKQIAHTEAEIERSNNMIVDSSDPHYCADCQLQFMSYDAFTTHLGSSYKHATTNL